MKIILTGRLNGEPQAVAVRELVSRTDSRCLASDDVDEVHELGRVHRALGHMCLRSPVERPGHRARSQDVHA